MAVHVPFVIDRPYGRVEVLLEIFEEDGKTVCGIYKLAGRIGLGPKRWVEVVRKEMRTIEGIAREAGCVEMRLAGRDWSRLFPDYMRLDGPRNGLRKAL